MLQQPFFTLANTRLLLLEQSPTGFAKKCRATATRMLLTHWLDHWLEALA
jgi:hypothetical protein